MNTRQGVSDNPAPLRESVEPALAQLVLDEIDALHAFFELWLRGESPQSDAVYSRFERAVSLDFSLVTPDGQRLARDQIIDLVREDYGGRPGFRLWIENARVVSCVRDVIIAEYEEWQTVNNVARGRLSTAVFTREASAPGGVSWIRVHETWLPAGATPAQ